MQLFSLTMFKFFIFSENKEEQETLERTLFHLKVLIILWIIFIAMISEKTLFVLLVSKDFYHLK